MSELNEELRELISQERHAYNEERSKFEEEMDSFKKTQEMKVKIVKNKLLMVMASENYGEMKAKFEGMTLDEIVKNACEMLQQARLKSN